MAWCSNQHLLIEYVGTRAGSKGSLAAAGAVAIVQQQDRKPFEWRRVIGVSLGKYRCTVGGTSYS